MTLGYVLDADHSVKERWAEVTTRLRTCGLAAPSKPPLEGYVQSGRTRVGVWLMPNNRHRGALEQFLATLVPQGDRLFDHAKDATREALKLGAAFAQHDVAKADLHAYLAWQEEPGRPYGTAIENEYLGDRSEVADAFVKWYRRLFEPS